MEIIGGLDLHRRQITYDYVSTATGELSRGKIAPATREELRDWLTRFEGEQCTFALEACTGWRFVTEELTAAGHKALLAEPAETNALRGRKRRAKNDRVDARHLRELAMTDRIPECWIPPGHLLELRTRIRLYRALTDERRAWMRRIHAQLFHQGVPPISDLLTKEGQAALAEAELSPAGRETVDLGLRRIQQIDEEIAPVFRQISWFAYHQEGCKALMERYGVGPVTSAVVVCQLGDARRFSSSKQAVRLTGLDITVAESDGKRRTGKLSRQGPPMLRWALVESAQFAARKSSPDHEYYLQAKQRVGHKRACLSVARRTIRWAYHTLFKLGELAISPPVDNRRKAA